MIDIGEIFVFLILNVESKLNQARKITKFSQATNKLVCLKHQDLQNGQLMIYLNVCITASLFLQSAHIPISCLSKLILD